MFEQYMKTVVTCEEFVFKLWTWRNVIHEEPKVFLIPYKHNDCVIDCNSVFI